ncbi:MAG: amidohydrolase [Candidatus Krumholzibacteria bacterium]|nr:amidohydrolase [Candidatus Krumholzibacteria bacterium]
MLKRLAVLAILLSSLLLNGCGTDNFADLVLTGGTIMTADGQPASAIALKDGRILSVGNDLADLVGPETRVIELDGAVVSPGFNDSHAHLYGLGKSLGQIDLMGTESAAEAVRMAQQAHADLPDGTWLEGRGWDQNDWAVQDYPTAAMLDAVTGDRPTFLRRVDGHAAWANSAALRAAGITADTPDPEGGEILRDSQGRPTGILIDNGNDLVRAAIPEVGLEEMERRVKLAVAHCWSEGVTGVHEAGVSWRRAELYKRLAAAGELDLRLYGMYDDVPATLDSAVAAGPYVSDDHLLTMRAIKLYGDGALGSRGALLLNDYSDQHGYHGLAVTTTEHLREVIRRGADSGFQLCTHAIGDGANRLVLDLYEELLPAENDLRWRVEHAQILHPDDIPRFGQLGVIAAMQPTHCTSDMDWANERLGDDRLLGAYAWRSLLASGAHICFGTDFPVERVNPLHGLFSARTRTHHDGTPPAGWQPQEILTGAEAHSLYTAGSAYAAFQESELGRLAPGYLADLVVLDGNPVTCEPQELLSMQVLHTVVHGELVYSK